MSLLSRVNYILDESCAFSICLIVLAVDAYRMLCYDSHFYVPIFITSGCLTAGLSKGLKRVINQSRPPGAPKLSPGMPSNHATALSFLCVSTVFELQKFSEHTVVHGLVPTNRWKLSPIHMAPDIPVNWVKPLQAFVILYSVYLTRLRVVHGHHTMAQVVVGYIFGASCAALCLIANYAGFAGGPPGGRVDALSFPMKTMAAAISTFILLVAIHAACRSLIRGHALLSPTMHFVVAKGSSEMNAE
ncbi:hypothetical protein ABB37_02157 [Leptomonas pyrrhocoris]|uniref:Phosphatidic acid phosphatase type 2/haloperoxidase domain-containing protein n=1 Tax=Leptomonas pyrrhocoris TaxID=157538 RepID=A0A0N0DYD2_LEPPY|nr:hypothetical protein ABB37_02157 [Leptomonas pyrrhocoris]XP_015662463.1 hypothetical protein ABB37_02157 [Leptomonas pyrrhocoris]XP_015662464.1 hypothetical protein ABB37_02157 [Leptomonas pyrrhocoris]KPA84023.1 hypothetical protein ABB37_02157 [Leptomonas pyrrhocoris]KPA84024.1 hypothetical protein ABB37_02157 [Leptomonas pyrrhocoris]KPA84025.1 hypothetical protein ABB37_02157 [Leptomonas pyrrhocoris]|eukprot:XP_015662462.1 hypothetical protein ABB37_02157 [Leptomonas pyrrhocoris]